MINGELGADRPDFGGRKPRGEGLATKKRKKKVTGLGGGFQAPRAAERDRAGPDRGGPLRWAAGARHGSPKPRNPRHFDTTVVLKAGGCVRHFW